MDRKIDQVKRYFPEISLVNVVVILSKCILFMIIAFWSLKSSLFSWKI
jgi:flagellar biosynthesis protein FlhB